MSNVKLRLSCHKHVPYFMFYMKQDCIGPSRSLTWRQNSSITSFQTESVENLSSSFEFLLFLLTLLCFLYSMRDASLWLSSNITQLQQPCYCLHTPTIASNITQLQQPCYRLHTPTIPSNITQLQQPCYCLHTPTIPSNVTQLQQPRYCLHTPTIPSNVTQLQQPCYCLHTPTIPSVTVKHWIHVNKAEKNCYTSVQL